MGIHTPTSFLKSFPAFPVLTGNATTLQLAENFPLQSQRLLIYGGGMRNLWHKSGLYKPWMTWQEQMQLALNTNMTMVSMHYTPGIRYLANRHNWGGYQAIFGLRERETNTNINGPEVGNYYIENPLAKDAIISFSYPNSAQENQKSRLIFEKIEADTSGLGADQQTELATLTEKGNLGFGTINPQARIEIVNNPILPQTDQLLKFTNSIGSGNFLVKHDQDGNTRIWSNYNPSLIPNAYHTFFGGGAFGIENPKITVNGVDVGGSEISAGPTEYRSRFKFGNKMSIEHNSSEIIFYDKDNEYLRYSSGGMVMKALKAPAGQVGYLTIDDFGTVSKSTTFPNPLRAWSYEGNLYSGSQDLFFGTNTGSSKDYFGILLNGVNMGSFNTNYRTYAPLTALNTEADMRIKGTAVFGGMATLQYPMQRLGDAVTLQLTGVNRWSDYYYQQSIPDFQPASSLIRGYKPLVDLGMNQVGQVQTFNLFQSGVMELGEIASANNNGGTFNTPLRYNSVLSIGGVSTMQTMKYSIATYKPGDMSVVRFGVGYDNPTIFLGKSEIKDISGTSGTNPEKLEVKGALIPKVNGSYNLGSSSNSWDDVWAKGSNIATSDRRLKRNISKLEYGLKEILQLNPVTYYYLNYDQNKNLRIGFIAQELDSIMPKTVVVGSETDSSYLGVRYEEIIPILTKAIQEQQVIIEGQKKAIEIIQSKLNSVGFLTRNDSNDVLNKEPILFQNTPNPFSNITFIDYFIPENCKQASIIVIDGAGRMVYSYSINSTGMGRVTLEDTKIAQGNYFYSLYANGRLIDTKQLSVVKQ